MCIAVDPGRRGGALPQAYYYQHGETGEATWDEPPEHAAAKANAAAYGTGGYGGGGGDGGNAAPAVDPGERLTCVAHCRRVIAAFSS